MSNSGNNPQSSPRGPWIKTASGGKYHFLSPEPQDINIKDIAAHLSKLCRFTGATKKFYSVAEHSILVSYAVPQEHALTGLLHDATEAYLGDVSRPLKKILPEYQTIEDMAWGVVAERFGLPKQMHQSVHAADIAVFVTECAALGIDPEQGYGPPAKVNVVGLSPKDAEKYFLDRYRELML